MIAGDLRFADLPDEDYEVLTKPQESIFARPSISSLFRGTMLFPQNPSTGNKIAQLQNNEVEFTEFEPFHFRRVRIKFGIEDDLYINLFRTRIKERLTEGGASGAFFFFSKDEIFIAKSCTEEEVEGLKYHASEYADYLCSHKNSYISKIYGAYMLRIYGNKLYFFVMNNIYLNNQKHVMHEKYDLKGSWENRSAARPRDGDKVTCAKCEQKFVYRKKKKTALQVGGMAGVKQVDGSIFSSTSSLASISRNTLNENLAKAPFTSPNLCNSTFSPLVNADASNGNNLENGVSINQGNKEHQTSIEMTSIDEGVTRPRFAKENSIASEIAQNEFMNRQVKY